VWVNIQNKSHGYKHYLCISPNSEFYTTEDVAVTFCSKEFRLKRRGYGVMNCLQQRATYSSAADGREQRRTSV